MTYLVWLVVSTHLKNISQNGNLPQTEVKIKKYLKPPPSSIFYKLTSADVIVANTQKEGWPAVSTRVDCTANILR